VGSCPRPPAPTTPLNGLPAGARDLPCPSRRPWKPPRATRAAVDAELSVRAAMDPLLVPLGFARGQGGGGDEAVIIWCAAYTDFTRRPRTLTQGVRFSEHLNATTAPGAATTTYRIRPGTRVGSVTHRRATSVMVRWFRRA